MDSSIGWVLDVAIEQNHATIWIKKEDDGAVLRLTDTYRPHFYILPKNEDTGLELFHILSQQSKVKKVEWEYRYINLFDCDEYGKEKAGLCLSRINISLQGTCKKSPRTVR